MTAGLLTAGDPVSTVPPPTGLQVPPVIPTRLILPSGPLPSLCPWPGLCFPQLRVPPHLTLPL